MGPMTTLLMPLPAEGFDPTETAVPWRRLRDAGIDVVFSTPDGRPGRCDPRTLERAGFWLTFWKLGRHFRTYSEYVESEIRRAIGPEGRFESGP
ncbi:MAG TPA: hypothetical protein ENI85_09895, partial [Deltaproteobacteria bacterium]|nr:hypothetical protein [Deltaproteobacteria bacterium]